MANRTQAEMDAIRVHRYAQSQYERTLDLPDGDAERVEAANKLTVAWKRLPIDLKRG